MRSDPIQRFVWGGAACVVVVAIGCGDLKSGTGAPGSRPPVIDPQAQGALPATDPTAMWPVEDQPTVVVLDDQGAGARFLRDYLWIRPLHQQGLAALIAAHPYVAVTAPLRFDTPEGPIWFPLPDLLFDADGAIEAQPNDVLVRIDWSRLDPNRFIGVDLSPFFPRPLTASAAEAVTLLRMVVWMTLYDSDKIAGVQPVAVVVQTAPSATDQGTARRPPIEGDANFCPCLDPATDPPTYMSTRVRPVEDQIVDCGAQAILTGRNLLTLTWAQVLDLHEPSSDEANFRLWLIPDEDLPVRIPGWSPSLVPPLIPLPFGLGVFIGESGQLEKSVPPHAHSGSLRGPYRRDHHDFCEWTKRSDYPRALTYDNDGQWEWRTDDMNERVWAFLYESDECLCWTIFCICNPDDVVDFLPILRGDTLDGPHRFREGGGVTLSFATIDECRDDPEERCDGIDNDCDNTIDEGDPALGEACPGDHRVCVEGTRVCQDGRLSCVGYVDPGLDVCNGLDDDCDGTLDEDDPHVGLPCGDALGVCEPGALSCAGGAVVCSGGITAGVEVCGNEVDDDCDGGSDEVSCICQEGRTRICGVNQGACTTGTQLCNGGAWGACTGTAGPGPETCDGLDNSCDGSVDEGCACPGGAVRPCGSSALGTCLMGTQRCLASGVWGACEGNVEPAVDVCDGLDNDCDGAADNVGYGLCTCVSGAERPCGTDTGACVAGVQTCVAGSWSECSGIGPAPEGGACDGLDNNCNGVADEGLLNLCGVCGPEPIETCNYLDDDCDGLVDENDAQQDLGLRNACGACGPAPAESCNDLDDDCDGLVDDELVDCGLAIVEQRFELHGNTTTTIALDKPAMGNVQPLVMVDEYQTNGDDDPQFQVYATDLGASMSFEITTEIGNGGSAIIGRVALIGLGANADGDSFSWRIDNGESLSLGSLSVSSGATDAIPFVSLWTMHTAFDDDLAYQTYATGGSTSASFAGYAFDGNGGSYVEGRAHLIRFPETTFLDQVEALAINDTPLTFTWSGTGAIPTLVPLTSIRGYIPSGDDDASWAVRCRRDGTDYICFAEVSGGNSSSLIDLGIILVGGAL